MTKPDITTVPTLAGRELDAAVHEFVFGRQIQTQGYQCHADGRIFSAPGLPHYSRDRDQSLFDVLERMDRAVLRKHKDEPAWHTAIVVANGVCKEADGDSPNEALARAALLTTYPPKEATDAR